MSSITNGRGGNHSRPPWKIPNTKHANPTRQFHEWVLLFPKEDGYDNMLLATQDFFTIWDDPSIKEMKIRGKMILTGQLYGCHGHINGRVPEERPLFVDSVKRLSNVKAPEQSSKNRIDRDEMCLYTDDGEQYFFVKSDLSLSTAELLSYFKFGGDLNHYVPDEYREDDII